MKPADRARVAQVTEAIIGLRAEIVVSIMRKHDTGTAEAQPLSAAQHLTLSVLRDEPLSVGDVAERTGVSASTTTRMLQGLKRKALIMDVAAPTGDRRHRYVTLTDSGREVADVRSRELVSRITQILGDLDHDEVEILLQGVRISEAAFKRANPRRDTSGAPAQGAGRSTPSPAG